MNTQQRLDHAQELIALEVESTTMLLMRQLGIDRGTALQLIEQIDDDDIVNMLIDGEFDHTPSPAATALHLSDQVAHFTSRVRS